MRERREGKDKKKKREKNGTFSLRLSPHFQNLTRQRLELDADREPALQLGQLPDDELVRLALNSLPSQLALGRGHVIEARVHRWLHAVSALPGGCTPLPIDRRHQPDPLHHPNLFVVGDYLFDSTLNGVLDSAEHVSGWLSDLINAGPGVLL